MPTAAAQHPRLSAVLGFAEGVRLLARGFRVWGTSPRLMLLGLVPSLITFAIITAVVVVVLIGGGGHATRWGAGLLRPSVLA